MNNIDLFIKTLKNINNDRFIGSIIDFISELLALILSETIIYFNINPIRRAMLLSDHN